MCRGPSVSSQWRRVGLAALAVLASVPLFAAIVFTTPEALVLQPSDRTLLSAEVFRAALEAPTSSLLFFLADSLFVLAFFWLVAALVRASRSSLTLWVLVAALIKALADIGENLIFALAALQRTAFTDLTLLHLASDLKRGAAIVSVALLAVIYPKDRWLGRVIAAGFALASALGLYGFFHPAAYLWHPHALLLTLPLVFWDARQRGRA